jgi:predicted dehydrogenase
MSDMRGLRWGILGTGMIAGHFANDLLRNGHTVAAVGSRTTGSAQRFAERFGLPTAHGAYTELCADPAVDAVYVATPNPFHTQHAVMALEAGKHVLLEKPFTLDLAGARQVLAVAAEQDRTVMEAMWTRFLPHMVRLRELIGAGTLGEVRAVVADLSQAFDVDPANRFYDPGLGGGALLDLGVYAVSLAVDVLGVPTEVKAIVTPAVTGVDARASLLLGFPSGAHAALHVGIDAAGPMTASIIGAEARVDIDTAWHRPSALTVTATDGSPLERFAPEVTERGMQYEAAAFERLVANGSRDSDVMPHAHTLTVLEVIHAGLSRLPALTPSAVPSPH